ncbi:NTP transferase domain-containing protein [Lachnospira multipara]|uniref:NTP transferase domain-containing protein n=1 Tax=Lachnospira multipara TaxID=28051 RepID=UPI0004E28B45|nr:NTP transferase domain-containing protein [Lachnospira multipara]
MNIYEKEVLTTIKANKINNQRELSNKLDFSLGKINTTIKSLRTKKLIKEDTLDITSEAKKILDNNKVNNAIILAAGYGMRMVPINTELPKGLIQVRGETLVERLIKQLHEAGITKITLVAGFMKELYEFLMDEYDVDILVNPMYHERNNLHSLALASRLINGTYIIPCDMYFEENPFRKSELYSWYAVDETKDYDSYVEVTRKLSYRYIKHNGNHMLGLAYISTKDSKDMVEIIGFRDADPSFYKAFWEDAFIRDNEMIFNTRIINSSEVTEINTYEQLRDFDEKSLNLNSKEINIAANSLDVKPSDIKNIEILKKGMTNKSFSFETEKKKYIMRIPGKGTNGLVNRKEEYSVYQTIKNLNLCDDLIYMNPDNGYKITEFIEGARNCDAYNPEDLRKCMSALRKFHSMQLKVEHSFDLKKKINYYEELWGGESSAYVDYETTKAKVFKLLDYVNKQDKDYCLCHIDSVPDNFMLYKDAQGKEQVRLIDWEYAGMQDPNLDIAMFAIYAMYDRVMVDKLIDYYYTEGCSDDIRHRIYAYIAIAGLLWSNWCEYKRMLGVEFGEYSLRQYRYAKDYYKIIVNEVGEL